MKTQNPLEQLLKQFEQVKKTVASIQDKLKTKRVEATAGAGLVKVVANGNQEIIEVDIAPELIKLKDKALLEDLIKAAVNEAREKAMEASQELVKEVAGFPNGETV